MLGRGEGGGGGGEGGDFLCSKTMYRSQVIISPPSLAAS